MNFVKSLRTPPVVGEAYKVECVFGTISNIGWHKIPPRWWPVFTPSHQDSVYASRYRAIWKEVETESGTEFCSIDEVYYEDDPNTPHHYHIDPRFTPEEFYTSYEVQNKNFHSTIRPEGEIEVREMICVREMPIQKLFNFGKQFVADHAGKKMKGCDRCPHKGVALSSMPVVDGRITCPAHGLQFDCETRICISGTEEHDNQ